MRLRVIGSGVGRTGMDSLTLALEWLGYGRWHHMTDLLADPARAQMWIGAFDGSTDWDATFEVRRRASVRDIAAVDGVLETVAI